MICKSAPGGGLQMAFERWRTHAWLRLHPTCISLQRYEDNPGADFSQDEWAEIANLDVNNSTKWDR